jgi:hypothetical protein
MDAEEKAHDARVLFLQRKPKDDVACLHEVEEHGTFV